MDMKSFRTFFLENNKLRRQPRPIPAEFDDTSPVVVVGFNNDQAGEVLVVSKVRGGNRFTTVDLQAMCVVFYPNRGKAKIWLTI